MSNIGGFALIAYCFSSSSWGGTLVYEREFKLKYSLTVMGTRPFVYWIATFVFDYLMFLTIFGVFMLIVKIVDL